MRANMGTADRLARALVVAPAAIVIGVLIGPGGVGSVLLYALAAIMLATAAVGSCPLYTAFGLSTCQVRQKAS